MKLVMRSLARVWVLHVHSFPICAACSVEDKAGSSTVRGLKNMVCVVMVVVWCKAMLNFGLTFVAFCPLYK